MAHDRDHDHQPVVTPREPRGVTQKLRPDYKRREHPSSVPSVPIDPKSHPSREAG